jgi:hypothetical protein
MKTRPVVTELFHADGRMDQLTDITKLRVAFRNFTHSPKNLLESFRKIFFHLFEYFPTIYFCNADLYDGINP